MKNPKHPRSDEVVEAVAEQALDAVVALEQERDELKEQLLRALADFQNLRRRSVQERDEVRRYATEELVRELLPVLDNFERTIEVAEAGADLSTLLDGVRAIDRQLRTALNRVKLQRLSSEGTDFDPEHHEAVELVPVEDGPENRVIEEIEPGYLMGDRVIRPARVKVSKRN